MMQLNRCLYLKNSGTRCLIFLQSYIYKGCLDFSRFWQREIRKERKWPLNFSLYILYICISSFDVFVFNRNFVLSKQGIDVRNVICSVCFLICTRHFLWSHALYCYSWCRNVDTDIEFIMKLKSITIFGGRIYACSAFLNFSTWFHLIMILKRKWFGIGSWIKNSTIFWLKSALFSFLGGFFFLNSRWNGSWPI